MRGSTRMYDVRMAQFAFKKRKIVPYYGCARILKLTVFIPDYGSWDPILEAVLISIKNGIFKSFENGAVKLSAKETKWTSLEARTNPTFLET